MASLAVLEAPGGVEPPSVNEVENLELDGGEVQALESLCMNCHEQVCDLSVHTI